MQRYRTNILSFRVPVSVDFHLIRFYYLAFFSPFHSLFSFIFILRRLLLLLFIYFALDVYEWYMFACCVFLIFFFVFVFRFRKQLFVDGNDRGRGVKKKACKCYHFFFYIFVFVQHFCCCFYFILYIHIFFTPTLWLIVVVAFGFLLEKWEREMKREVYAVRFTISYMLKQKYFVVALAVFYIWHWLLLSTF